MSLGLLCRSDPFTADQSNDASVRGDMIHLD